MAESEEELKSLLMKVKEESKSQTLVAQLCPTLCDSMDLAHQVSLSIEFSRQEYWSGLPLPSPGDLPDPGIKCVSSTLQTDSLLYEPPENIQNKIMSSGPITSWQIDGETMETWHILCSWAPKSLQLVPTAMKLKDTCSLEEKLWPT